MFEVVGGDGEGLLHRAGEGLDGFFEEDVAKEAGGPAFAEEHEAEPDGLGDGEGVGGEWLIFDFADGVVDGGLDVGIDDVAFDDPGCVSGRNHRGTCRVPREPGGKWAIAMLNHGGASRLHVGFVDAGGFRGRCR